MGKKNRKRKALKVRKREYKNKKLGELQAAKGLFGEEIGRQRGVFHPEDSGKSVDGMMGRQKALFVVKENFSSVEEESESVPGRPGSKELRARERFVKEAGRRVEEKEGRNEAKKHCRSLRNIMWTFQSSGTLKVTSRRKKRGTKQTKSSSHATQVKKRERKVSARATSEVLRRQLKQWRESLASHIPRGMSGGCDSQLPSEIPLEVFVHIGKEYVYDFMFKGEIGGYTLEKEQKLLHVWMTRRGKFFISKKEPPALREATRRVIAIEDSNKPGWQVDRGLVGLSILEPTTEGNSWSGVPGREPVPSIQSRELEDMDGIKALKAALEGNCNAFKQSNQRGRFNGRNRRTDTGCGLLEQEIQLKVKHRQVNIPNRQENRQSERERAWTTPYKGQWQEKIEDRERRAKERSREFLLRQKLKTGVEAKTEDETDNMV